MKRIGNLFDKICAIENLMLADEKARKGKANQHSIVAHDKNKDEDIQQLHQLLITQQFANSRYKQFVIFEPKRREISVLPYFPDRILHHAVMNILEPVFMSVFTADTYSSIKGRGIHKAANAVKKALGNEKDTPYCLKLDIEKFYPSIDHNILKQLLRRKFKDKKLLWLLDLIIDSATGLPIGNYLSQFLSNFYLAGFDHWLKEVKGIQYYFRYCDDIVILHHSKEFLHIIQREIKAYLYDLLKLKVKGNWRVFPVASCGIDFLGYRFFHTHTLLRKRIKKNFAKMIVYNKNKQSIASYMGWLKHCDSKNLIKKLLNEEL